MNKSILRFFAAFALTATIAQAQSTTENFLTPYRQDFVTLNGKKLEPFNSDKFMQATYFVLYFGAGWCPDCLRFSPSLVRAYANQGGLDKKFEVLLLPRDKSEEGMIEYMKSERMKWPAYDFAKYSNAHPLHKFSSGKGIPCLTVVDAQGNILLQSKDDKDAADVLKKLKELVRK